MYYLYFHIIILSTIIGNQLPFIRLSLYIYPLLYLILIYIGIWVNVNVICGYGYITLNDSLINGHIDIYLYNVI